MGSNLLRKGLALAGRLRRQNRANTNEYPACGGVLPIRPIYDYAAGGREVVIETPEPPHPLTNILYNSVYYTIIDHAARGLGRHMTRAEGYTNNVIQNERLLYVRDAENGEFFSVTFAPCFNLCARYQCRSGLNYQSYEQLNLGLRVTWRIYVPVAEAQTKIGADTRGEKPQDDPVEIWDVRVQDFTGRARCIQLFAHVGMLCDGTDLYTGEMARIAKYDARLSSIFVRMDAERHQYIDFPWHNGFMTSRPAPAGWDCNPGAFLGPRGTSARPRAVVEGKCENSAMPMWPCIAALQVGLEIAANSMADARFLIGACDHEPMIAALRDKYLDANASLDNDPFFDATQRAQTKLTANIQITTPEPAIDAMANAWLKKQIHYGAYWGRWGWKGYRDCVQQALGIVAFDPALAREEIISACLHQYADGFALRGWRPVDTKRYADSAQWLIHAVTEYVKETGDRKLLDEVVPYYADPKEPQPKPGTVREHIERALERLHLDRGPHGLCLAHGGDWNDSLTGVCRRGRGESIWLSMAYCRCALLMRELAEYEERDDDAAKYGAWHSVMARAVNTHGWDGEWYLCALDDDGEPIGSQRNDEGKLFLNMQSWAQLGGICDNVRWTTAWSAVEKHLNTGWGLTLNWPVYRRPHANVGRMSFIQPGAAENGMVYTHGNAFMMMALLERGKADRALQVWRDVAPGAQRALPCQPNVFFNGYYGPDSEIAPNLADHSWMTGSVAWMMHALVEMMIGLRRHYDGLHIEPCFPSAWGEASITREFRGTTFRVRIINPRRAESAPIASITIDGTAHDSARPLPLTGKSHDVVVTLQ